MLCFDRRLFLTSATALAGLAACQFQPVYGPGGSGTALNGKVLVSAPDTSNAFTLRQELELGFGPPVSPQFSLTISLTTREQSIAVTEAQDIDRYNIIGSAGYQLTDIASGAVLRQGQVDSFAGYSASGTTVATLAAEQDGYRRLMTILANKITAELISAPIGSPQ